MNLAWKLRRLQAMGPAEIAFRVGRAAQAATERLMLPLGLGTKPPAPLEPATAPATGPWLSLDPGVSGLAAYTDAADQVLAGRVTFFTEQGLDIGFPPRWNVEPKSGIEIPLVFGKTLNYRDISRVGNVKYVWEINRHPHLVTLAQAWHLTGDARYLEGCRTLLDSWITQCPYPLGINWTCSLEPAMRLVNWSAAWHLLGAEASPLFQGAEGRAFRARWLGSVWQHCRFIAGYLSRHSSANNHLLGELLGLYAATTTWPLWRESEGWRAQAQREFEREALLQNSTDGVNREQAVFYHHFVLEMMIFAGQMSRAAGQPFSDAYWKRVEAMLELLASVMDAGGHTPSIGDEDGAVVVKFPPGDIEDVYRSLLAKGAVLFGRGDFRHKARDFGDQCRWLLGREAASRFEALAPDARALPPRLAFPEGGWYVLGDQFETPEEIRLVVDVAPLGFLGIAAHGHADALACTLSVGGEEVLIDPGTYGYYIEKRWRDYFRSTAAHNTVCVDGVDQSVSGGPFLWTRHAQATCEACESTVGLDRLAGAHDGYTRLADPVTHRREYRLEKSSRVIDIIDSVECRGTHHIQQSWHFPAGLAPSLDGRRVTVRTARHVVEFELPDGGTARLLESSHEPLAGWRSLRFGDLQPCCTLTVSRTINATWKGCTRIRIRSADA